MSSDRTCDDCFEELDRYVDASVPGTGAHLEGCPACCEDHDSLAALLTAESP